MNVGELIKKLQRLPKDAPVILSTDEEGNWMKELSEITFDKETTGDLHGFLEVEGPAVTLWPRG